MAETHPVRLPADEIRRQAIEFFGKFGLGMSVTIDEPTRQRFENAKGFVELTVRPDSERQVRLLIDHHNCDESIHEFKRLLARESEAGRAELPGEHHIPVDHTH